VPMAFSIRTRSASGAVNSVSARKKNLIITMSQIIRMIT
jgi:hypothetical protein